VQEPEIPVQPIAHSDASVHLLSAPLPAEDMKPEGHSRQRSESWATIELEYLPAAQSWQAQTPVAPIVAEYLPMPQLLQVASDDSEALYLPASQLAQRPPLIPEKPALHLQLDNSLLAAGASEPAGHIQH